MKRRNFLKIMGSFISFLVMSGKPKASTRMPKAVKPELAKNMKSHNQAGRVVAVHCPDVTSWDFKQEPYVDYSDSGKIRLMLDAGMKELTTASSPAEAWQAVFATYRRGNRIAIKLNLNDVGKELRGFYASPVLVAAIVSSLVKYLNVPEQDITVYDCARGIPDAYRKRVDYNVYFVDAGMTTLWRKIRRRLFTGYEVQPDFEKRIDMDTPVVNDQGEPVECYLPGCLSEVSHIINVPIFKSHQFILASGALKNHYGTVRFSDGIGYPKYLHPPIIHQAIAAINAHPDIVKKTRLVIMDALFGRIAKKGGKPEPWKIFDDQCPNRLFLSRDPVALDTVSSKYIKEELSLHGEEILSDEYLALAEKRGLGTRSGANVKEIKV